MGNFVYTQYSLQWSSTNQWSNRHLVHAFSCKFKCMFPPSRAVIKYI